MKIAAVALGLILATSPAYAGHGGGNGGHGNGGGHGGRGGHSSGSAHAGKGGKDRQDHKASRFAFETGLWHVGEFVDGPQAPAGPRFGQITMTGKGTFTGATTDKASGQSYSFTGKVNARNLVVKGKTGDGYKIQGLYHPYPSDPVSAEQQTMGGNLFKKGDQTVGTFTAQGSAEQELP